jgi:excisionase family DNA binding protein
MNQLQRQRAGISPPIPLQAAAADLVELFWSLPPAERAKQFIGTANAAQQLGISRRTVQTWIELGAVSAVKVGRTYRVFLPSLKTMLVDNAELWTEK